MEKSITNVLIFIIIGILLTIFMNLLSCKANDNTIVENYDNHELEEKDKAEIIKEINELMNVSYDTVKNINKRRHKLEKLDTKLQNIIKNIEAYRNKKKIYETNGQLSS